jgi:hypothetical protein
MALDHGLLRKHRSLLPLKNWMVTHCQIEMDTFISLVLFDPGLAVRRLSVTMYGNQLCYHHTHPKLQHYRLI